MPTPSGGGGVPPLGPNIPTVDPKISGTSGDFGGLIPGLIGGIIGAEGGADAGFLGPLIGGLIGGTMSGARTSTGFKRAGPVKRYYASNGQLPMAASTTEMSVPSMIFRPMNTTSGDPDLRNATTVSPDDRRKYECGTPTTIRMDSWGPEGGDPPPSEDPGFPEPY